jgi:hypothetical protein
MIALGVIAVAGVALASQFHWDDKVLNDQMSRSRGLVWMECVHDCDVIHFVVYADADRTGGFSRGDKIVGVLDYRKLNSAPAEKPVGSVNPPGGVVFGRR